MAYAIILDKEPNPTHEKEKPSYRKGGDGKRAKAYTKELNRCKIKHQHEITTIADLDKEHRDLLSQHHADTEVVHVFKF